MLGSDHGAGGSGEVKKKIAAVPSELEQPEINTGATLAGGVDFDRATPEELPCASGSVAFEFYFNGFAAAAAGDKQGVIADLFVCRIIDEQTEKPGSGDAETDFQRWRIAGRQLVPRSRRLRLARSRCDDSIPSGDHVVAVESNRVLRIFCRKGRYMGNYYLFAGALGCGPDGLHERRRPRKPIDAF